MVGSSITPASSIAFFRLADAANSWAEFISLGSNTPMISLLSVPADL
jgi:hypothetical protein